MYSTVTKEKGFLPYSGVVTKIFDHFKIDILKELKSEAMPQKEVGKLMLSKMRIAKIDLALDEVLGRTGKRTLSHEGKGKKKVKDVKKRKLMLVDEDDDEDDDHVPIKDLLAKKSKEVSINPLDMEIFAGETTEMEVSINPMDMEVLAEETTEMEKNECEAVAQGEQEAKDVEEDSLMEEIHIDDQQTEDQLQAEKGKKVVQEEPEAEKDFFECTGGDTDVQRDAEEIFLNQAQQESGIGFLEDMSSREMLKMILKNQEDLKQQQEQIARQVEKLQLVANKQDEVLVMQIDTRSRQAAMEQDIQKINAAVLKTTNAAQSEFDKLYTLLDDRLTKLESSQNLDKLRIVRIPDEH